MELRTGYKQTEVGVIPEDWDIPTIEDIAEVKSGKRLPLGNSLTDKTTQHPYIRVADMESGTVNLEDIKYVPEYVYPAIKNYRIFKDDIFISVAGTLGVVGKIPHQLDGANLTENADRITKINGDRNYLMYVLMSPLIQNVIESERTLGAQPKLALTRIRKFRVPLPPTKKEQTTIANALSDADALIQSLTRLIAKKRQIKQGAMQTLLNPYENGRLKEGWVVRKLGELAKFINGRAYSLFEWESQGTPVIRLQNLTGRGEKYYYSNLKLPEKQYCVFGDLLFMWSATFGPVIWKGGKAIYHYHIWKIECDPSQANKTYMFYILDDLTERLKRSSSSGGTMLHVTKGKIESTEVTLPCVEEQTHIATILSDMDTEIEALETKLTKYQKIKQGMMQNLLTGKIRLLNSEERKHAAA